MRHALILWIALCAWLPASAAPAADPSPELRQQRAEFLSAEQALHEQSLARYQALAAGLRDYPLYPYLRYEYLRTRLSSAPAEDVVAFIDTHSGMPLSARLRELWLESLARHGHWETLLRYAPESDSGVEMECYRRRALYKTGDREAAFAGLERLWLVGHSQPHACDPLFAAWTGSPGFDPQLAWQRFELSMAAGQTGLARYLVRFLDEAGRKRSEIWLRAHRNPRLILTRERLSTPPLPQPAVVRHAVKRLAWIDARAATAAWDRLVTPRYEFSTEESADVEHALALAMAVQGRPEALSWLASVDESGVDTALGEWRVRVALDQENWYAALAWIYQLEEQERDSPRWRYWQARALEALGQQQQAEEIYLDLALNRGYYSFLAADRLQLPYRLNHEPSAESGPDGVDAQTYPGLARARELFALGRLVDARREWYYATRDMAEWQLVAAAKLARDWGWHDRAIMTMARTAERDDLELRFPLVHEDQILATAKAHGVDPAFAFAVIRQESAFTPDARSQAGALGLMQLLPATARRLARHLNISLPTRDALLDVRTNLQLGMAHLSSVLQHYGHEALAAAAYNAGEQRVDAWLPRRGMVAADAWIENVPFRETRDYVQNVLYFATIYQQRMDREPVTLTQRMPPVAERARRGEVTVTHHQQQTPRPGRLAGASEDDDSAKAAASGT